MSRETLSLSKWFELFRPKPQMLHNQSLWHQPRGVMAPASCRSSHGAARAQEPGSERTIQWETPQTNSQWIIVGCNLNDFALGGSGLQTSCVTDASMFTVCHITGKEERRPATHHKWPLLQMSLLTHTVVRKLVKLCFNDCNLQILVTRSLTNALFLLFFFGIFIFGVNSPNCLDLTFFRFLWRTHQNRLLFWQWFCDLSFPVTAATELRPRFLPLSTIRQTQQIEEGQKEIKKK